MKFCPNCGTQCEDQALFCGECGFSFANAPVADAQQTAPAAAPQPAYNAGQQGTYNAGQQGVYTGPQPQVYGAAGQQPQPQAFGAAGQQPQQPVYNSGIPQPQAYPEKKKSKVPIFIAIAVAAVALIAIAAVAISKIGGGGGVKSADFVGSQQAFLEERAETFAGSLAKETFATDMTISAEVNGSGELSDILGDLLSDSAVVLKLDNAAKKSVINAALRLRGSNVLEAFASFTDTELRFSIPNANGNLYVADINAMMDNLGIDFNEAQLNVNPKEVRDDLKEITNRYIGVFSTSINKEHLVTENNDVKLSEVGKTVKCTVMTWTPDEDELMELCDRLADELENDDKLAELLSSYVVADGYYDDGYEMLGELADELRDGARDFAEDMVDENFTWTVAVDSKGNVAWISIATDEGEVALERAIDADGGAEAYYATSGGNEVFMMTNDYKAKGQQRTGELVFDTSEGSISVDYDFDLSKKSVYGIPYGTYKPNLISIMPGLHIDLTVTDGASGSTDHIIEIDGLGNLTDDMVTDVTLTVNTTDKSSAKEPDGKTVDISDYDEDELYELFEDLMYDIGSAMMQSPEIMDLLEAFGGAF